MSSADMTNWLPGYTRAELEGAQDRFGLRFPPDLFSMFLDQRPAAGYNWASEDNRIHGMLAWPTDMLIHDVDHGSWWTAWGERPENPEARHAIVHRELARAPRLIPLIGHRFIPEVPNQAGNPIFSMYGFDTIYYGSNLGEYFSNEFLGTDHVGPVRTIPFWSDLVENCDKVFRIEP